MRILVVEDDTLTAHVLRSVITECGHEAVVVHTLAQASAVILSIAVHAALLDVNLPDGASYAIARALRSQDVPFFFATGEYMGDHVGFADVPVIQKPFDRAKLLTAIGGLAPGAQLANPVGSTGTVS